jgi:hypothetical protein
MVIGQACNRLKGSQRVHYLSAAVPASLVVQLLVLNDAANVNGDDGCTFSGCGGH